MKLLNVVSLAALLASASVMPATAQELMKMASVKRLPDVGAVFDAAFADSIKTSTGGAYEVEIQHVPNEQEMVQQVIRGRLPMGVTSPLAIAGAMPDAAVMNLPYLWLSNEERDFVYTNYLLEPLKEMFLEKGLVLLALQESGYNGVFCKFDCSNPSSLSGVKVRVSPSAAGKLFWDSIGTNPVQLPLSELWPGLEQNLVSGGDLPIGYYSASPGAMIATHFVYTNHIHSPWLYFMNKAMWDKLPAETQQAILAGAPAPFSSSPAFFADQERLAKSFIEKGGTVYELTDEQRQAWADLVTKNIEPFLANNTDRVKNIYELIKQGKAEFAAKG